MTREHDAADQAGVEPATVLVRTFQIHVAWVGQVVTLCQYALVTGARVEPNVHDVGFFLKLTMWRMFTGKSFWQQVLGIAFKPNVGAILTEQVGNMVDRFLSHDWRAVFSVEDWQWYAPDPLTRDDPVAAILEHVVQPNLAPAWVVLNFINGIQDFIAHLVN